jgi:hypothetical protein
VGIHLAREHALKFQALDHVRQARDVAFDLPRGRQIVLFRGQFQELSSVLQSSGESIEVADDALQLGSLLAQFLSAIRIVPYAGLFELPSYLLEAFVLVVVIKDTSSRSLCAPRDL